MSDENSSSIELNRRRVLGALGTVGVASAGAGAGTFALFSDTESSTGNSVQAGTLDLANANGNALSDTANLDANDIAPGNGGSWYLGLQNTGSISGDLSLDLSFNEDADGGTQQIDPDDGPFSTGEFSAPYWDSFFQSRVANVGWTAGPGGSTITLPELGIDDKVEMAVSADSNTNTDVVNIRIPGASEFHNFGLAVDAGSDGSADYHIGAYGPASDNPRPFYKTNDSGSWSSDKTPTGSGTTDDPYVANYGSSSVQFVTAVSGGDFYAAAIFPEGTFDDARIGGLAAYQSPNGAPEQWYPVPFTPGFDWSYGTDSNGYVEIGTGETRQLANVLDVDISVYNSYDASSSSGSGKTTIASGKLANVLPEVLEGYSIDGTDYLVIDYALGANAGNTAQGDEISIDIDAELVQN